MVDCKKKWSAILFDDPSFKHLIPLDNQPIFVFISNNSRLKSVM